MKATKIISSLLLATILLMSTTMTAFAAENVPNNTNLLFMEEESNQVSPRLVGDPDDGYISSKGQLTLHPTLNSYVGVTRTFYFSASTVSSGTTPSGDVKVWVYKPNGTILRHFAIKANKTYQETFTLPPSGEYKVNITSTVPEKLFITTNWGK